ncbi:NADPH:quinone reductase-like Zn-dependent oxidoreductase [Streptomyces sp. TE12347]
MPGLGVLLLLLPATWAHTPARWNDEQAAGAGLAAVTAMRGLDALGPLAGRTVLIEGAVGGVGSAAVEIAVARSVDVVLDAAASGSLDDLVAIAGDPKRVATVADHAGGQRLDTHVADGVNDSALLAAAAEPGGQGRYTPRIGDAQRAGPRGERALDRYRRAGGPGAGRSP